MPTEVRMPRLTWSMAEGLINEWLKPEGATVAQGEPLLTVESDKSVTEIEAAATGTLLKIVRAAGETVAVDQIIGYIGVPGEKLGGPVGVATTIAEPRPPEPDESSARPRRVLASPAAKRLAAERGIELSNVSGSGRDGTILESDVLSFSSRGGGSGSPYGSVRETSLTSLQRAMSERMLLSKREVVQGTTFAEVDMTAALEVRQRIGASVTGLVAKAVVLALAEYPLMNSSLKGDSLRLHGYVNLGVAVATERGLVVPVIHNAERLDARGISQAIDDRSVSARSSRLAPQDMADATFTVTNSGALGALAFVPIVNFPENAILGMGKVLETPVVRNGEIVARHMMHAAVSYNHRIIDGATAVTFLQKVRALLEAPTQL